MISAKRSQEVVRYQREAILDVSLLVRLPAFREGTPSENRGREVVGGNAKEILTARPGKLGFSGTLTKEGPPTDREMEGTGAGLLEES